jgi:glycolate oxidase FAD binding subunit
LITPRDEADAALIIRDHAAKQERLAFIGGGTRPGLLASDAPARLTTRAMSGITLYEPAEMVIGAWAGTPVAEIEATLAEKGQRLPFEPMDHRALYGTLGEPTIGAIAAGNISGPRRIQAGAARDCLIGLRFINGRGEIIRAGGRVMKNVTGLDLVKLQAGAFGRLGLLTETIFKVLPKPETAATLMIEGLEDERAIEALSRALGSPFDISGAAHRPKSTQHAAQTIIRIENFAASVSARFSKLATLLAEFGKAERIDGETQDSLWRDIRDLSSMAQDRDAAIWRISVKPSDGPKLVSQLKTVIPLKALYDWGGGLVWIATADGSEPIRAMIATLGGHARLERAGQGMAAGISSFQPMAAQIAQLEAGIARAVDPDGLFAPSAKNVAA